MEALSFSEASLIRRTVNEGIKAGYINRPGDWRGNGHVVSHFQENGTRCTRQKVLITTVCAILSPYIAFACALRSAQSAYRAKMDLEELKRLNPQPLESEVEHERTPPPAYRGLSSQDLMDIELLLDGRKAERTWVAISQSVMCVGSTLLALVFVTTIVAKMSLILFMFGIFTGTAFTVIGAGSYGASQLFHSSNRPYGAAMRISHTLNRSSTL